tara:strand:+ start:1527 stop:2285 length:759 start_codon:yes stop_codon:yes gene_type:complete
MEKFFKFLFFLILISFTSCVSRKEVQLYQGISDLSSLEIYTEDKINIKPDDRLSIKVFSSNQEAASPFNPLITSRSGSNIGGGDPSIEYLVSRDGTIDFPVLGKIEAEGYNVNEFADFLKNKISPYLSDPIVMVRVNNFSVSFIGAVNGRIEIQDDQINLSQALSQVGGLNDKGRIDNILVIREKNGIRTSQHLDLTDANILESPYFYLEQNDIVYVEPTTPARQQRGYLGTVSSYIGILSSVLSLIVIFTR